ncbi:hypothetical protein C0993_006326, partial [Termitomyces sp. T159_Od127]
APAAPSFDEELETLLVSEEPLVVSLAAKSKEAVITPLIEQDLQHQDKFWQEIAKESEADVQWCIANSLKALAWEGLGLGEATGTGKESQQGQEEEEGTKEKTPETMAGAATGAAMPAGMTGGIKGLVLPAKKMSSTKLASKHRGRQAPRYKVSGNIYFELTILLIFSDRRQLSKISQTGSWHISWCLGG